jgi:hypothetical protein
VWVIVGCRAATLRTTLLLVGNEKEDVMLEFSQPEAIKAEVEYRQARAKEMAHHYSWEHSPTWLPRLFRRHRGTSEVHDENVDRLAA